MGAASSRSPVRVAPGMFLREVIDRRRWAKLIIFRIDFWRSLLAGLLRPAATSWILERDGHRGAASRECHAGREPGSERTPCLRHLYSFSCVMESTSGAGGTGAVAVRETGAGPPRPRRCGS